MLSYRYTFTVCAAAKGRVDEDGVEIVKLRLGKCGVRIVRAGL